MQVSLRIVALLGFIKIAASLPAGQARNISSGLQRRGCEWHDDVQKYICDNKLPTVAEIVAKMRDEDEEGLADEDHRAVFYSNLRDPNLNSNTPMYALSWMLTWIRARGWGNGYYWALNVLTDAYFRTQQSYIKLNPTMFPDIEAVPGDGPIPASSVFELCYYEAEAMAAINPDAYVFTRADEPWKEDSIWERVELPALTNNPNIKRIWQVDPRPASMRGQDPNTCQWYEPVIIWDRNNGGVPWNGGFKCPVV